MVQYTNIALAALATGAFAARPEYVSHQDRMDEVRAAFQTAWDGYYNYGYPNDTLKPVSKTADNDRNGWGASTVDALSTALVMGEKKTVQQIVDHIATIDWTKTAPGSEEVSVFETTIRYLGGILSGYDFLKGPMAGMIDDDSVESLLTSATKLADQLSLAFDTPTGIPDNSLMVLPNGTHIAGSETNGLATTGTLVLEFSRLSDLVGDQKYHDLAYKAEQYLIKPLNPAKAEPFPGMRGTDISINTGKFTDSNGGWNGGTDSYYEYLIKMYLYDTEVYESYLDQWIKAADSSIKYLASHPSSRPELTFLAGYNSATELSFAGQHLACFYGGSYILGGLTLKKQEYVDFGLDLTFACHETYNNTASGVGPDQFAWQDSQNRTGSTAPPSDQADFFEKAGYWITSAVYDLRPEVIESFYYAYRATGDPMYQEWAWDAFKNIERITRAGVGFSEVENVNAYDGGKVSDFQESFWFAEVLKYSYLIQAPDAEYQVNADNNNQWVWNTEAHPVKVNGKPT